MKKGVIGLIFLVLGILLVGSLSIYFLVKSHSKCTDSDNGLNYYKGGEVKVCTGEKCSTYHDSCSGQSLLKERYCRRMDMAVKEYMCEYGCKEGACLEKNQTQINQTEIFENYTENETQQICEDFDGEDYFTKGNALVKINDALVPGKNYTDYCIGENKLVEFICQADDISSLNYTCENGCIDGACVISTTGTYNGMGWVAPNTKHAKYASGFEGATTRIRITWSDIETTEGSFNEDEIKKIDKLMVAYTQYKLKPYAYFKSGAGWQTESSKPRQSIITKYNFTNSISCNEASDKIESAIGSSWRASCPPDDLTKWKNFQKLMTERYDGDSNYGCTQQAPNCYKSGDKLYPASDAISALANNPIKIWYIESEPNGMAYLGTPEDYIAELKASYETIKQVDSQAKIATAGVVGIAEIYANYLCIFEKNNEACQLVQQSDQFLNKIMACNPNCYDYLSMHFYENSDNIYKSIKYIRSKIGNDRIIWVDETGYGVTKKPIYTTLGDANPQYSDDNHSKDLVRRIVTLLANNAVPNYYSFSENKGDFNEQSGLITWDTNIRKPAYYVYKDIYSKLKDFQEVSVIKEDETAAVYKFKTKDGKILFIAWARWGKTATIDLSQYANGNVNVTKIVTALNIKNSPIYPPTQIINSNSLSLDETPVFIEVMDEFKVEGCTDSDGGSNYNLNGTAKVCIDGACTNYTDSCISSTKLREYYCYANIAIKQTNYSCSSGKICSYGACITPSQTNCSPTTCSSLGKQCGTWSNGTCTGILNCGTCSSGQTCSDGNCIASCTPSCAGKTCGDNGCGGSCGTCSSGLSCSNNVCTAQEGTITLNGREFSFEKPSSGSNFPVIIILHGGGQSDSDWFSSNKQSQFVTDALADGYAIISPNSGYPIYSACTIPTKAWYYEKDWASSNDYTFFNAIFSWINANYDLNSNRVYATGISSGGFMSSRLARSFGTSKLKAIAIHSAGDADTITHEDKSNFKLCTFGTGGAIPSACGPTFNNIDSIVNTNHPPTLIIHGKYDGAVPVESANHYYDELNSAGIPVTKFIKTTWGIYSCHSWFSESNQKILDWFGKYT